MDMSPQCEPNVLRILLYRNKTSELLVESTAEGFRLPVVLAPPHTRIAEKITTEIMASWNLNAYCLFPLPEEPIRYYVAEISEQDFTTPVGMRWQPAKFSATNTFANDSDFRSMQRSLTLLDLHSRGERHGFFAKPGCLNVVTEWVEVEARKAGFLLTGKFHHINASPASSLVRFETNGPAIWFKAVCEPHLHEFPLSLELARSFPHFVPAVLAAQRAWNAWLTMEVPGTHLGENSGIEDWILAARCLAQLQIASTGRSLQLIVAGCLDLRPTTLLGLVDSYVELMCDLMQQQTKASPQPLPPRQLLALGLELKCLLAELDEKQIPSALGHLDLNPGNILVSRSQCTFLDWAEACVSHPLFSLQFLLARMRRLLPENAHREAEVHTAYLLPWQSKFSMAPICRALELSSVLAVFAYAISLTRHHTTNPAQHSKTVSYLRSLTRRLKREVHALHERRALCVLS
jgi:hypothetical protein